MRLKKIKAKYQPIALILKNLGNMAKPLVMH